MRILDWTSDPLDLVLVLVLAGGPAWSQALLPHEEPPPDVPNPGNPSIGQMSPWLGSVCQAEVQREKKTCLRQAGPSPFSPAPPFPSLALSGAYESGLSVPSLYLQGGMKGEEQAVGDSLLSQGGLLPLPVNAPAKEMHDL